MEKTLLQSGPSERAQSSWVFIFQAAPESEVSCCHPLPQIGIGKQRLAYLEFQQNWEGEEFNFLLLGIHMWRVGWERSHERPSLGEGAGWYWVLLSLSGVLLFLLHWQNAFCLSCPLLIVEGLGLLCHLSQNSWENPEICLYLGEISKVHVEAEVRRDLVSEVTLGTRDVACCFFLLLRTIACLVALNSL